MVSVHSYAKLPVGKDPEPGDKVNIFACDEWAVYSSRKVDVVPGFLQSAVVDSDLKCDVGGEFGAWLLLKLQHAHTHTDIYIYIHICI